jgi:SAM-dependent methyltransferase
MLKILEYNKCEKKHANHFPNYTLLAFSPVTFIQHGWPHNIENESNLWRYIDTMQENRFEHNLSALGFVTQEEFELLKLLTEKVLKFTESLDCKFSAKNSITRSIIALRVIKNLRPAPSVVLEVGPGSGYLSALLALSGYKVISLEITQSFYLYQNRLFEFLFQQKFIELANGEDQNLSFENADLIHLPWWLWANTDFKLPEIDIVSCNHAINEMHPLSAKFLRRRSDDLFRNDKGLYIFESSGLGQYSNLPLFEHNLIKLYHGTCNGQPIADKKVDEFHIYGKMERSLDLKKPHTGHPPSFILDYYKHINQLNIKTADEQFADYIQSTL